MNNSTEIQSPNSLRRSLVIQAAIAASLTVLAVSGIWHRPAEVEARIVPRGNDEPAPSAAKPREKPLRITPLYNDAALIDDDDLSDVLSRLLPRFSRERLTPNVAEHAVRVWGAEATFAAPDAMSGSEMVSILTDHALFAASWNGNTLPLLEGGRRGVLVRWGDTPSESQHPDHWLACLSEAEIPRDALVSTPQGRFTFADALEQAAYSFDPNHLEIEWSALSLVLWLPPQSRWVNRDGREVSFDQMALELIRPKPKTGACAGTHRLYTLTALLRVDDEHHILTTETRGKSLDYLRTIAPLLQASQHAEGYWTAAWGLGAAGLHGAESTDIPQRVVATGHHLEWLAIAPAELHPPRDDLHKAARWLVRTIRAQDHATLMREYMFYSHVLSAFCLWRSVEAADMARKIEPPQ
jgi:hypothetical protein